MKDFKELHSRFPQVAFPKEPPVDDPKPELIRGKKHEDYNLPESSLWFSHDPAIYKDPNTGYYYVYNTGAVARVSIDLLHWKTLGVVVPDVPKEAFDHVGTHAIWAPDIVKVGDEYRLYCSNSSWGVRQSCIFLAVSDKAEGPFEPKGIVLKTTNDMPVNAIDANIIEDVKTGEQYMVYGSFWGGCHILKLDKETGYAAEEGIGTCVARRPMWTDRAIEGPYIIYNPDTEYYYLFVSYGSLNSDYNIRVGRSKSVTGPYLDFNGRDMTDLADDTNEIGLMIACGYRYQDGQDYMAPGHNSVLRDDDGKWYVVCHIREHDMQKPQPATMHIYQMFWTEEGWPFLCPQRYAGESRQPIPDEMICGHYERIKLAHTIPQGVQNSVYVKLFEDGRAEICSLFGTWERKDDQTIILRQGNTVETLTFVTVWDYQRWEPALAFTGMDQKGICVWGKRIDKIEF